MRMGEDDREGRVREKERERDEERKKERERGGWKSCFNKNEILLCKFQFVLIMRDHFFSSKSFFVPFLERGCLILLIHFLCLSAQEFFIFLFRLFSSLSSKQRKKSFYFFHLSCYLRKLGTLMQISFMLNGLSRYDCQDFAQLAFPKMFRQEDCQW